MRALCDVCEGAPAQLFCTADEAALCLKCDGKVHGCNKLASRHVRLELAEARAVPRCDICENAPAFFFCCIDGTSLCLQCDMDVHIAGKKTHERYLLMGQRVKLPRATRQDDVVAKDINEKLETENDQHRHHQHHDDNKAEDIKKKRNMSGDWNNGNASAVAITVGDDDLQSAPNHRVSRLIDLNSRPAYLQRVTHVAKNQEVASSDDECAGVVPQTIRRSSDNSD